MTNFKTVKSKVEVGELDFNELSYEELSEHVDQAVNALKERAYHEGYLQGLAQSVDVGKAFKAAAFDDVARTRDRFRDALISLGKISLQQQRDKIVERAKRDVEELKQPPSPWQTERAYVVDSKRCNAEFIINNDKRAVVVLIRWRYDNSIQSKGIAKCAPNDCFNVHIGKAIALRRALGLEVPAEYLNAPQPTEVRVGDVVELHYHDGSFCGNFTVTGFDDDGWCVFGNDGCSPFKPERDGDKIIDDSRDNEPKVVR